MNAKEFFDTVAKMREAQKDYFRTRQNLSFQEAKCYESRIDDEIVRVKKITEEINNPSLF